MDTIDKSVEVQENNELEKENIKKAKNKAKIKLYDDVQTIIKNVKLEKYIQEGQEISSEGLSFFGGITGKNDLQIEKMKNVRLKIELVQAKKDKDIDKYELKDLLADIYACAIVDLGGSFTPEMSTIYNNIKEKYYAENNSKISDEKLYELACKKINNGKSYLPVIHKEKPKGIFGNIKVQTEFLKLEYEKIKNQIAEARGIEKKIAFIIPNNVKNAKNNLTNA